MKSHLYTRTGDAGLTSLVGGARTRKDSARLEAYGTIDELNSWLGLLAASQAITPERRQQIARIQNRMFDIGAILATPPSSKWTPAPLSPDAVKELENLIDLIDASLPPLNRFILPGGHPNAANANIARTVARRAERRIISLSRTAPVPPEIIQYINRLSDFLFALGREINIKNSIQEIFWEKDG